MAKIVERDESNERLKEIDKTVKNKFRWNWLERSVRISHGNSKGAIETASYLLGQFIRKVDKPGMALCITCDKLINYGSKGAASLDEHCVNSMKHSERMSIRLNNSSMDSFVSGSRSAPQSDSYGIHPDLKKQASQPAEQPPLVPMCDRISNAEDGKKLGMILGFIAEHSLSLSMAPALVDLAKALAQDKAALNSVSMGRHAASYKMTHGLSRTFTEETVENLRNHPFSINIDESTSNNNTRILAILVSYFLPDEGVVRVEHLASVEVLRVNAQSLFDAINQLFTELEIPWTNLVSGLMDSCNVMRGSKNGVEMKLKEKAEHLLDIDGDSCHHIHNACKKFCAPFGNWIEDLIVDLFNDFKWSSDLKEWLAEICEMGNVKFTVPERYVPHRWLSVYDVCLSTHILMDCYVIFYFGFLPSSTKDDYMDVIKQIFKEKDMTDESINRIEAIHKMQAKKWKSLTPDGKNRKNRIMEKLLFKSKKTSLNLQFYIAALPLLQAYVKVFQSKESLAHQLHDKQLDTFQQFLVCFIKPEVIAGLSGRQLKELNLRSNSRLFLPVQDMYVGGEVEKILKTCRKDDPVVEHFRKNAASAYLQCAEDMQLKLPLHNKLLQALSVLDPTARGHAVTVSGLKKLAEHLDHFLSQEQKGCVHHEILKFQVDGQLPAATTDAIKWWSQVNQTRRYPALCQMAEVGLSIFHGPQVESSFNLMGDILDAKSCRMNVETLSSIQTVKYAFQSRKTTSVKYFARSDMKHSPVNRRLCRNMRMAAGVHKRLAKQRAEARQKHKDELKLKAGSAQSKVKAKLAAEKSAELSKQAHVNKLKKRALENLMENRARKKKKL